MIDIIVEVICTLAMIKLAHLIVVRTNERIQIIVNLFLNSIIFAVCVYLGWYLYLYLFVILVGVEIIKMIWKGK